jgi:hypothetical protein
MITRLLPCLLLLALVRPCSARRIKAYAGNHANFAGYKTYQWLPVKTLTSTGIIEDDPTVTPVIKDSVSRELAALGLTEVREYGDLQVATFASINSVPQLEAVIFPNHMDLDFATPIATMGRYNKEGTLAINLIDTRTNKSAWAALVTDSINDKRGSGAKKIPGATAAMFKKYPIKRKYHPKTK